MSSSVETTVIGSYPIETDNSDFINSYFNSKEISWNKYIKTAVDDFVNAGLDIIADGQTRDPFVNIFLRKLKGCRIRDRPEIIDKIEYNKPITIEDIKYVKKLIPEDKKIIGLIAGPYTLAKSVVDNYYKNEEKLAFDFAYALQKEADNLNELVDIVSVDEPFFSNNIPEYASALIEIVTKNLTCPIRLHACGDVSKVISNIIELPVDILSHEFKASPYLFDSFKNFSFPQKICLGCVRTDDVKIESVDEIKEHIKKGIEIFGEKIIQLSPDCGMRLLPRNVAYQKLINLVAAGGQIYGR